MKTIKLTNTDQHVALVDDEDYLRVLGCHWRYDNGYAKTGHNTRDDFWRLHDFIMGEPKSGFVWEHKDLNGLNNQRNNLRLATRSQNGINRKPLSNNTSGYKGVRSLTDYKGRVTWQARITYKGTPIHIGTFLTKEDAALAYNKEAISLFGEFAFLNKIE